MFILGSLLLWLSLSVLSFGATVQASVDENPIIVGESVELAIEAEGERVEFPQIEKIGPYRVTTEGSQRLERFDDDHPVIRWIQLYTFTPKKSVTIPSLRVVVDGVEEKTAPIFVQVKPNNQHHLDDFLMTLQADREQAYVGQMVDVKVIFREKRHVPVLNVDFVPIQFEDFWVKRVGKERRYVKDNYLVHEIHYLFFPQKSGVLTIGPAKVKVAIAKKMRDMFGFIVQKPQWITLTSPSLKLDVKPLPNGLKLIGDFKLDVQVEPQKVEVGQPVRLTVRVEAEGNIEDFDLPPLQINGVTIYDEAPKIDQHYRHGIYSGVWEKTYLLIADRSFVIPPITLCYFDPTSESVKEIVSEPMSVEVVQIASHQTFNAETPQPTEVLKSKKGRGMDYGMLFLAFVAGMGVMYLLLQWREKRKEKNDSFSKMGRSEMLQQLMPYIATSHEAAKMADQLYSQSVKVDRKAFKRLLKRLQS
jgi:hypothetical protein